MPFEDILARCLDALEHGETIEHCLARYPQHAAELAALLRLATGVRSTPQPRLSASAFARGRIAVVAQARYQQAHHTPFSAARGATPQIFAAQVAQRRPVVGRRPTAKPPSLVKPFLFFYKAQPALLAFLLTLSLFAFLRNISISLPGASLYPAKILAENMQGVLLTAAGEQAAWHAHQTENRVQELVQLAQQGKIADSELEKTIDQQVQATLAASNNLPTEQRNRFLLAWLTRLQELDKDNQLPNAATLIPDRTLAAIHTATQVTVAYPTPGLEIRPTVAPTPSLADSRTTIPVATPSPTANKPLLTQQTTPPNAEATVFPSAPVVIHPTTVAPALAPAPIVLATATTASIVVQVPQEPSSNDDNHHNGHNKAAASQPKQTTAPVSAAASTQTPSGGDDAQKAIQPSTSPTTSAENTTDQPTSTGNEGKPDVPTTSATPTISIVDSPTPATDSGPAIAPVTPSVTGEATSATLVATAIPSTSTPSFGISPDKTGLPTRAATVEVTPIPATTPLPIEIPSSTAANTATPVTEKTATIESEKTIEPTATAQPTDSLNPTNTPDQSEATLETQPTPSPGNTPTPKSHKKP
jgi:hypothetical protein